MFAVSDEDMQSSGAMVNGKEPIRTSNSSPHLFSMAERGSPQEDQTDGRGGGGRGGGGTPLYAVVKKVRWL